MTRRTPLSIFHGLVISWFVVLCGLPFSAWAAEVTATVDRQKVTVGETVTLVLQTNDAQQSLDTDFSVFAEDFEVIDQRSETQMSIVNGRQAATVRVLLVLEPRRTGTLVIPELSFAGANTTAALSIEVQEAPELAPGELPAVFIEVELDPLEGPYYVHAQLSLKVRIFYQQNLTEAAINPPAPEQASVRLLDEVPYQADRNGVRYRVLERRYAIFPERSGEMSIPPMQLTGRLIERPSDRLWQPSVRGRRVRIESDPMVLSIAPRPPEYKGDFWLPARKVELAQQISDGDSVHVGEPVTRTVIVDAVGLEEHMLEEPVWPDVENSRIYPDQPQGISRDNGQWVLGHREYRYAVVPEVEGELRLPEIRLQWWDTVNHRQREAVLPEHIVKVLPSQVAIAPPVTLNPAAAGAEYSSSPAMGSATSSWWRLLTILFAVLWVITLVLYIRRLRSPVLEMDNLSAEMLNEAELLNSIKQACKQADVSKARALLGSWVRGFGPANAHGSMSMFANVVEDQPLSEALQALSASGFARTSGAEWDGGKCWEAFDKWHKQSRQSAQKSSAESFDLYAAAR